MKKTSVLRWIFRRIRRRLPAIAVLTAAYMGHALFSVFFALGSRNVIDSAVDGEKEAFLQACLYQAGIIAMILLCITVYRHLRDRLTADLERDWKQNILHGLLHGAYADVSSYHSAELLNRMNNDVAKVNDGILTVLPSVAGMLTRIAAAVWVLGTLDAGFTGLIIGIGVLLVLVTGAMRRRLKELNKLVSDHDGRVSAFLQEAMEKLLMVQAMGISGEMERRAKLLMDKRYDVQRRRKNVSLLTNTGISVLHYGAGFLALCWCAWQMLQGRMTFGSLTAVTQLVNQLQNPFVNLSGVLPKYIAMTASAERLLELEQIQGEPAPMEEEPQDLYSRMTGICAEHLTFAYDRDSVLREATFCLKKGSFAVVTGPSGIGKSTLLKLLLGVIVPQSGQMYLSSPEGNVTLDRSTRKLFAYVPQGNLLLSGTIRENLSVVRPQATEEELRSAVYASTMDEFLPQLPLGLDTPLGESGMGLSEGQAQRLAIARAVLGGAPIMLLDECTSALDAETERKVLLRLKSLPNRTCIAVTHRPAAMELSDCLLEVSRDGICLREKTC
ncbi:MAG: ABC transporter ATP-binding protein [Oscillospiraceae bacterium]|nr:ABC transporter ATP-binding protein [Oscillospiraceae bacterium]